MQIHTKQVWMDPFFFSNALPCPVLSTVCHQTLWPLSCSWAADHNDQNLILKQTNKQKIRSPCFSFFSCKWTWVQEKQCGFSVRVWVQCVVRVFVSKSKQHLWIIGLLVVVSIHGYLSYTYSTGGPFHHPLMGIMFLNLAAFQCDGPERVCVRNVESFLPEASCPSCPLLTQSNKITLQLQHLQKLATNNEILYTKCQLIKLWADM